MTDKDYTLIHVVADRTGSMNGPADGKYTKAQRTTDGVHALVNEQRKLPGKTEFSMLTFDTEGKDSFGPGNGDDLLAWECQPRGGTPLLDAVGTSIVQVGERLAAMPEHERPGRVMFIIATDGQENASREYTKEQVGKLIATQKDDFGWDFSFIGTGFDAFGEAHGIGIASANTMSTSGASYTVGWGVTNTATTRARASGQSVAYAAADYAAVADADAGTFSPDSDDDDGKTKTAQWKSTGRSDRSKN